MFGIGIGRVQKYFFGFALVSSSLLKPGIERLREVERIFANLLVCSPLYLFRHRWYVCNDIRTPGHVSLSLAVQMLQNACMTTRELLSARGRE